MMLRLLTITIRKSIVNGEPPNNTEVEMDYEKIKSDFDDPVEKMKRKVFYYRIFEVLTPNKK